jgi:hypothetical protein
MQFLFVDCKKRIQRSGGCIFLLMFLAALMQIGCQSKTAEEPSMEGHRHVDTPYVRPVPVPPPLPAKY